MGLVLLGILPLGMIELASWSVSRGDSWVGLAPDLGFAPDHAMLLESDHHLRPNPDIISFGIDTRPLPLARADSFRVIVVGGSSARGLLKTTGTRLVEESFSRVLERELPALTGHPVEVMNLGVPGFGTRRVRGVVRDALRLKPDLVIAYFGHNEFIEDRIRRNYAEEESWRAAARRIILSTWTGRLYLRRYREPSRSAPALRFGGDPEASFRHEEDPVEVASQFGKEAAAVLSRTRDQVGEIVSLCRAASIPILVVPAVPNILDRPMRPGLGADSFWAEGDRLKAAGDTMSAIAAFREALDRDAWGLRCSPRVRAVLVEAAAAGGARILDLWDTVHAASMGPEALFADYCHPNERGHRLLGESMKGEVALILRAPSREE